MEIKVNYCQILPEKDMIIELCLTIRQVYNLPLRKCTGFLRSIFVLMELPDLVVPREHGGVTFLFDDLGGSEIETYQICEYFEV